MGKGGYKPGSSSKRGHLYNPIPFREFADIPWQREACYERLDLMKRELPVALQPGRLLDVGCHTGFNCYMFRELGFQCTGIEIDPLSVEIAQAVNRLYGLDIRFICTEATTDTIESLGHFQVCLFLAVFQWITKLHGYEFAQDVLKQAMRSADLLFFETSMGSEGRAKMPMLPDVTSVERMLIDLGVHQEVVCLGEIVAPNAWLDKKRYLFRTRVVRQP
jgi:SAM-dependent methyltransferase